MPVSTDQPASPSALVPRRRWRMRPCDPAGRQAGRALATNLRLPPLLGDLLAARGLIDADAAARFLDPKLIHLRDPAELPGAPAAAERVLAAVENHQPIVIYGDYDVDGVTASAILYHALRAIDATVHVYIPHRLEEGYGLSTQAICDIAAGSFTDSLTGRAVRLERAPLIVTVDCGISAVGPAEIAREHGIDLIITDHHEFDPNNLPHACALVHPRLGGDTPYPFDGLCGAGVAFKLAWQVLRLRCGCERLPATLRELLLDMLSLAALGTVADVSPLIDENRVLVRYGLGQIKRTRIEGLAAMIASARLNDERISAYHVGFVLGPRLNACGRMGHAGEALRLLTSARGDEAKRIAEFLNQENERRRATERAILNEAKAIVEREGFAAPDRRAIVLAKEGWHAGVVGIVASRLVEAYARPAVMLALDGNEAHGSARSVEGVAMHEALEACTEHLLSHGGHAMAAGLRLSARNVDVFRERFVAHVNARLPAEHLSHTIEIDAVAAVSDLTPELAEQLERLAPFGRANPSPMFIARGLTVAQPATRMGKEGRHLTMTVRQNRSMMRAVGFGLGDLTESLPAGAVIDAAFKVVTSNWQGRKRIEMHLEDVRPTTETTIDEDR